MAMKCNFLSGTGGTGKSDIHSSHRDEQVFKSTENLAENNSFSHVAEITNFRYTETRKSLVSGLKDTISVL
jgi:hypothetical protein